MKFENNKITAKNPSNIKICGMKYADNILDVASLLPDYLGFIFVKKSPRYFEGTIPNLPKSIKKTGVFVNETVDEIITIVAKHDLQAVQLHGQESVAFCVKLRGQLPEKIEIIKAFSVDADFNFEEIESYNTVCDFYLFDTKGKLSGGNGITFDWSILQRYKSAKPFFLSGGIGIDELEEVAELLETNLPIYAIDCNSRLETEPGVKDLKLCESLFIKFNKIK